MRAPAMLPPVYSITGAKKMKRGESRNSSFLRAFFTFRAVFKRTWPLIDLLVPAGGCHKFIFGFGLFRFVFCQQGHR